MKNLFNKYFTMFSPDTRVGSVPMSWGGSCTTAPDLPVATGVQLPSQRINAAAKQ